MTVYNNDLGAAALPTEWDGSVADETPASGVSWGAIVGGAVAAIATTVILMVLGTGLGLTMISPWYGAGASAAGVGVAAIVGLIVIQWLSSGVGGFLAGRLRTKWVGVHSHEVFFRDTAHGFLAWSLASIVGAFIFASVTASGVAGVARGGADIAAGAAQGGMERAGQQNANSSGYFVDTLFRSATPADGSKPDARGETTRILVRAAKDGVVALSPDDRTYLGQLVASRTGLAQPDAEQRVDTVVKQMNDAAQQARQAADTARKRAAQVSILVALSMVIGAFIASAAGAIGGGIRDEY